MSRFSILRIDHFDPESVGKKNRLLFTIYGIIPTGFFLLYNVGRELGLYSDTGLLFLIVALAVTYFFLLRKLRATINKIKTIGELEITQSCIRKSIGDDMSEYNYNIIKEIKLTKHIPATRLRESKSRYFSYILKINFYEQPEQTIVVSDRSVDHNHKISVADTLKTLKKLVPFNVIIET